LINALYSAIENHQDKALIGKVIDNLIVYYQVHFQREEKEMLRINYPGYQEHKDAHDKFVHEVHLLKKNLDRGEPISATQVGKMLSDWLRNHIVKIDTKLAGVLMKDI
jgi:hemerythrin